MPTVPQERPKKPANGWPKAAFSDCDNWWPTRTGWQQEVEQSHSNACDKVIKGYDFLSDETLLNRWKNNNDNDVYKMNEWRKIEPNAKSLKAMLEKTARTCLRLRTIECESSCMLITFFSGETYGYVYATFPSWNTIHLCPDMQKYGDSKIEYTLLHEMTHFGGSNDTPDDFFSGHDLARLYIPNLASWYDEVAPSMAVLSVSLDAYFPM
jgi:hypothetical protein